MMQRYKSSQNESIGNCYECGIVCLAAKRVFPPVSFQCRHIGRVIMEPHRAPAVRESARLRLIALHCSWPQAGRPSSYQTCLIFVFGGLPGWAVKSAKLSLRSASLGKASRTLEGHPAIHFVTLFRFCFVFRSLPTISITFQTLKLNVEKALSIIFASGGSFCQTERCCSSY